MKIGQKPIDPGYLPTAMLERKKVVGEGHGGRSSKPMDIDQGKRRHPPAVSSPSSSCAALMDARLQQQGHSLTPHDVSPQPPLSNAATYRVERGGRRRT